MEDSVSIAEPSMATLTSELPEFPGPRQGFDWVYFERPSRLTDAMNLARTLFDLKEF